MVSLIFVKVLVLACGVWMVPMGLSSWSLNLCQSSRACLWSVDGTNGTIFMVSLIFVKVLMLACFHSEFGFPL